MQFSDIEININVNYHVITARARAPAEASKQRPPSADTPTDARIGRQMKGENTMTNAEKNARSLLAARTTEQLILDWELTESLPMTLELPTVRGWIMDEFKRRDAEAYESWCDDLRR